MEGNDFWSWKGEAVFALQNGGYFGEWFGPLFGGQEFVGPLEFREKGVEWDVEIKPKYRVHKIGIFINARNFIKLFFKIS